MSLLRICPSVEVVWWNDTDVCIRCPYCEELHCHSFVSYRNAPHVPHCGSRRPSYQSSFPVAYEIDKCKARFINIDALQYLEDESEDEDEMSLWDEFSNINISDTPNKPQSYRRAFEDSTEMIVIPLDGEETWEERRILFTISDCVSGNISAVKNYLETSSDKLIFLHGHDRNGDTCLIMASQEKNSYMVSLLLDHGAEINAKNDNGRTALMEAALWGRLEIIELLLTQGADLNLHDKRNRRAFDLALPTRHNRKERHTRLGGIWGNPSIEPVYKEDSTSRDADRREIARVLERKLPTKSDLKLQMPESAYHSFRRSTDGRSIVHYGPIQEYPISSPSKTVAILERANSFPTVAAMSGWGHSAWPSIRVSGKDWSRKVFELAALLDHRLSPDGRDQGIEGRFQASHAEKQLIAYFLDRHVFLPQDQTPDPRFDEEIKRLNSEIIDMACEHPAINDFLRLRKDKWDIENELFVTDDRLLEEEYNEKLVAELKERIISLNKQCTFLAKNPEVKAVKDQEHRIGKMQREKKTHSRLNRLSKMMPQHRVLQATILISSPQNNICDDCLLFKDKVNHFFGVSIDLVECTNGSFRRP